MARRVLIALLAASCFSTIIHAAPENTLENQFRHAPENPDFLYEKRFIPGNESTSQVDVPSVSIDEPIDDDTKPMSLKLPSITQTLLVGAFVLIFVLYRMQLSRRNRQRR